jgi:hypothetical protein
MGSELSNPQADGRDRLQRVFMQSAQL